MLGICIFLLTIEYLYGEDEQDELDESYKQSKLNKKERKK